MPPRRDTGKAVAESSRPKKRAHRMANAHGILFEDPDHQRKYVRLVKRKLIPARYICNETLDNLGLRMEVHRMFHTLGMLEFMQFEAPTFERITFEFLSSLDFQLRHRWTGSDEEYFGTLKFRLFDNDHSLSVEELGRVLKLPSFGPGAPPTTFVASDFWKAITGSFEYVAKGAKASCIHNPCFRYAQKWLAYTLFCRGDSTGVATQRELYLLYGMANKELINIAAFAADHLKRVANAATGDISVGGMITQIADYLGYGPQLMEEPTVGGKTKIDLATLTTQGMIKVFNDYYSLVSRNHHLLALPAPDFISIDKQANWLYASPMQDDGENFDAWAGSEGEADNQPGEDPIPEETPMPNPGDSSTGSWSMTKNDWDWMHDQICYIRSEQTRQGDEQKRDREEQLRQGKLIGEMHEWMQQMRLHGQQPPQ